MTKCVVSVTPVWVSLAIIAVIIITMVAIIRYRKRKE